MVRKGKLSGYSKYDIYEDGRIFSHRSEKFLRPSVTIPYGYWQVFLHHDDGWYCRWWKVHQLVLRVFIGPPPPGHETHHKDHNRANNHLSNLEWVTHRENIQRSYDETDRKLRMEGYWKGRIMGEEMRKKMSMAKEKPCVARRGDEVREFRSVEALCRGLGTYRKKFNRCIQGGKLLDGWEISFNLD